MKNCDNCFAVNDGVGGDASLLRLSILDSDHHSFLGLLALSAIREVQYNSSFLSVEGVHLSYLSNPCSTILMAL